MDKQLISKRFSKAIATYPQEANVQRQIADKMIHLLTKHISFPCSKVIEFGCGTGIYSRMLLQALRPEELFLNDLCPEMKYCREDILRKEQVSFLPGDAEIVPFPTGSTLITSCSAFYNGSNLPITFSKDAMLCSINKAISLSALSGKRI